MKKVFILFYSILLFIFTGCFIGTNFAPINDVTPKPETEPEPIEMVLMIYMAADNDLESFAIQNLKQMEHAQFSKVKVLVLLDRAEGYDETNNNWTDTRLFEVVHDDTNGNFIVSKRLSCPILGLTNTTKTELDMGNKSTLSNFIEFVKITYDAEKYSLIIWGHGTGWRYSELDNGRAVAIDDKTDSYMSVLDMGAALKNKDIAVVGFDTCFGGVLENIYELRNSCEYIVGSTSFTPASGWNYSDLVEKIDKSNFSSSSIADIMANSSSVKTTVFENIKINDMMDKFDAFSKALSDTITSPTIRDSVFQNLFKSKSYHYTQYPCDMYLDIYEMAYIYSTSSNQNLAEKGDSLMIAVNDLGYTTKSLNVEVGVHFIPLIAAETASPSHSSEYIKTDNNTTQCSFIKNSNWWVPTTVSNSNSLLDKIFYKVW